MLTEVLQRSSVQKLKGLLKDRYGMGLQITSMVSVADVDVRHMRSELHDSSLHVPVCARGKYLATAILTRAESLSESDILAVTEMVRLVLEPALFSIYLNLQESNMQTPDATFDDNLIQLRPIQEFTDSEDHRIQFNSAAILLESFNPHTIARAATHIHETGERWAMLRYNDIKNSLTSASELKDLGPMTLFIEDILLLSIFEQTELVKFAQSANTKTEPLILLGSTSSLEELIRRQIIVPELAALLEDSRLSLDRMPLDFAKLSESIELALDKYSLI